MDNNNFSYSSILELIEALKNDSEFLNKIEISPTNAEGIIKKRFTILVLNQNVHTLVLLTKKAGLFFLRQRLHTFSKN